MAAPFVYDDLGQIARNPVLASFHATLVRYCLSPVAFTNKLHGIGGSTYRPLFWLSLALDAHVWGLDSAAGFHATNLLLHWADGVLLFVVLRRIRIASMPAAVTVLVWLGLPINSEVVAWVSCRAYLLCGLFLFAGLLAGLKYCSDGRRIFLAGYFVLALAALLSQEEGVLLLPLMLLAAYAAGYELHRFWVRLAGAPLLAGVAYLVVRHFVGGPSAKASPALWSIGSVFWKYVQWTILPIHMSMERSTSTPSNLPTVAAIAAWAAMLLLAGGAVLVWKRMPAVALGLLWGLVGLLPFCGVVHIYQGMAERFCYLASAGFALAIASLLLEYSRAWKAAAACVLLVWIAWGGWRLRARVLDWCDPVALYRSSLQATPDSQTLWSDLGDAERDRGNLKEAVMAYEHALALRPNDPGTALNLALTLEGSGDYRGAEQQFKKVIALAPGEASPYLDLGALYTQEKRFDEAIQCFQSAIQADRLNPDGYFDLAVLLQGIGRDDVALPFYKKVLELRPGDPDTIRNVSKLHLGR